MTRYRPLAAAPALADELVCCWSATMEGTQVLVPDGCVDVLWIAEGGVRVCGPETSAWSVTYREPTEAVGIRFRPGAAPAVLATSAADLRNTRVDLADIVGSRETRLLIDQLDRARTAADRVGIFQRAASGWRQRRPALDPVMAQVGVSLAAGSRSIEALAAETGLTDRQLRRRCADSFGYGPATLRAILRLQRFMRCARRSPTLGLAALAVEAGYSDQSHLAKECRRIAGQTPSELLIGRAPDWHGGGTLFGGGHPRDVRSVQDRRQAPERRSAA